MSSKWDYKTSKKKKTLRDVSPSLGFFEGRSYPMMEPKLYGFWGDSAISIIIKS